MSTSPRHFNVYISNLVLLLEVVAVELHFEQLRFVFVVNHGRTSFVLSFEVRDDPMFLGFFDFEDDVGKWVSVASEKEVPR